MLVGAGVNPTLAAKVGRAAFGGMAAVLADVGALTARAWTSWRYPAGKGGAWRMAQPSCWVAIEAELKRLAECWLRASVTTPMGYAPQPGGVPAVRAPVSLTATPVLP